MSFRPSGLYRLCAAAALIGGCASQASAQDNAATWREIETKYIFGFTEGSGVGLEGEKEIEVITDARFGKRAGRYSASQTKLEYETTPNQFVQLEFGALVAAHNIRNVPDIDDRRQVELSGAFGELRYLLVGRGPASRFGVTLSVEPAWRRIDETSGQRVSNFELETKLAIDTELVENRVYAGFNLLYEPEATRVEGAWERESTLGVSGALAFRVAEGVLVGGEAGYFRHYDGLGFNTFTGDAVYLGPTLYVQLARKMFMTAAWSTQVFGREVENPGLPLNLAEFSRHKARLRLAMEF